MKQETQRGWWKLTITGIDGEISEGTLQHIAESILNGATQGEVIEEGDES